MPEGQLAGGGDATAGGRKDRADVTTAQQAKEVAEKRKANLEAKSLDKCPMCKLQHQYEKTWAQTTPSITTKMVSTLLTSCPKFLSAVARSKGSEHYFARRLSPLHVVGAR